MTSPETAETAVVSASANDALARIEERFRELVEWLPAVVYEAEPGPDGLFFYVSPQIQDLLGYTPEEWMADRHLWRERIHPDEQEEMMSRERQQAEQSLEHDQRIAAEYRMRHRNGKVVWVRDIARVYAPEGSEPFWRGVLLDITSEHGAQEALAEAHERHRRMVEHLPACVYRTGPAKRRWHYVSSQIERLLGYRPDEWTADPTLWRASLHADDRERIELEEQRLATASPGTESVSEYRLRHRNGRVIWVRDRGTMAIDEHGDPVVDGIITDITPERAAAAGADLQGDVYRLTCNDCGATWAAERFEPCRECGGRDVESVSLNAALSDLAASRQQVEGLLDGIQRHLDALGTNLRSSTPGLRPDPVDDPRVS